jgi:cobalt/nickel transport system permease protein
MFIYRGERGTLVAAALASWFSVVFASLLCAVEIGFSGVSPLGIVVPAMVGIHGVIGLGEAAISVAVLSFVIKTRPDLVYLKPVRMGESGL